MPKNLSNVGPWNPHKYLPAIDGLRTIAVLLVIVSHSYPAKFPGGSIGVDIFFAISGFLITGLLIAEWNSFRNINVWKFYGRRAIRLVPALLLMVTLTAVWFDSSFLYIISSIFYFSNWVRAFEVDNMGFYGHTWSLSVEEQFYIFWPLLLIISLTILKNLSIKIVVLILAMIGSFISISLYWVGWSPDRLYNGTDTRMIGLLLGAIASVLVYRASSSIIAQKVSPAVMALVLIGVIYVFLDPLSHSDWVARVVVSVLCALLVLAASLNSGKLLPLLLQNKVTLYLGKISYGLYLWHYPLVFAFSDMEPKYRVITVIILSIGVASASWYLVERPISRRLRPLVKV